MWVCAHTMEPFTCIYITTNVLIFHATYPERSSVSRTNSRHQTKATLQRRRSSYLNCRPRLSGSGGGMFRRTWKTTHGRLREKLRVYYRKVPYAGILFSEQTTTSQTSRLYLHATQLSIHVVMVTESLNTFLKRQHIWPYMYFGENKTK